MYVFSVSYLHQEAVNNSSVANSATFYYSQFQCQYLRNPKSVLAALKSYEHLKDQKLVEKDNNLK